MTPRKTVATTAGASTAPGYDYTWFLILIKILGLLSMIATTFIIRDVVRNLRRVHSSSTRSYMQNISLTQGILFCLALGEFFSAFFAQFLSTWMVPSNINVAMASGTTATCTVQGFCSYLFYGLAASSNASLAVAYSLIVNRDWKDDNKNRYRLPFTVLPIIFSLVIAITPLPGRNYNYNGVFYCDTTASPLGCDHDDSPGDCTRGANARYMLLYVAVVPFIVLFAIIIVAMALLVHSVWKQESRMDRYRREGMPLNRSLTRQTTRQGIYYILGFGLVWIPWYIYAIVEFNEGKVPLWLSIIHYITMPLQGVFNALVYFRPKYKSRRASNPSEYRINSAMYVLRITLPASECCRRHGPSQRSNVPTNNGPIVHGDVRNENGEGKSEGISAEEQKEEEGLIEEGRNESGNIIRSDAAESGVEAKSVRFSDEVVREMEKAEQKQDDDSGREEVGSSIRRGGWDENDNGMAMDATKGGEKMKSVQFDNV